MIKAALMIGAVGRLSRRKNKCSSSLGCPIHLVTVVLLQQHLFILGIACRDVHEVTKLQESDETCRQTCTSICECCFREGIKRNILGYFVDLLRSIQRCSS